MKFSHLLLLLTALAATAARAEDETTTTLKFSDPTQPGRLRAVLSSGEISIRGGDVDAVTIRSSAQVEQPTKPRPDGLRVITTAAQFTAVEENNVITIDYGHLGRARGGRFEIVVPRQTSVQLQNTFGGEIVVEDVRGDVEIKNMNGEIKLRGLQGGALVETMNGEVDAQFANLPTDKPIAFSSMNGEIKLRVPADAKANVRFRTQNGSILTDFPADALVTKTDSSGVGTFAPVAADMARMAVETAREGMHVAVALAEEMRVAVQEEKRAFSRNHNRDVEATPAPKAAPRAPRPPAIPAMAGGKVVSGTLNGGGATEIQIATMNGDIVVRKLQD